MFLGVDGGQSGATALIGDEHGRVLGSGAKRVGILRDESATVAKANRQQRKDKPDSPPEIVPYVSSGHPSIEQLMAEQGTGPITDVSELHGDFWPEEESVEEFVATIREWRGHKRTDLST